MRRRTHQRGRRRALLDASFFATVFAAVWAVGYLWIDAGGLASGVGTALIAWIASFAAVLYFGAPARPSDG